MRKQFRFKIVTEWDWLDSRGGRFYGDVKKDIQGKYVLMGNGRYGGETKVYLPKQFQKEEKLTT